MKHRLVIANDICSTVLYSIQYYYTEHPSDMVWGQALIKNKQNDKQTYQKKSTVINLPKFDFPNQKSSIC